MDDEDNEHDYYLPKSSYQFDVGDLIIFPEGRGQVTYADGSRARLPPGSVALVLARAYNGYQLFFYAGNGQANGFGPHIHDAELLKKGTENG